MVRNFLSFAYNLMFYCLDLIKLENALRCINFDNFIFWFYHILFGFISKVGRYEKF